MFSLIRSRNKLKVTLKTTSTRKNAKMTNKCLYHGDQDTLNRLKRQLEIDVTVLLFKETQVGSQATNIQAGQEISLKAERDQVSVVGPRDHSVKKTKMGSLLDNISSNNNNGRHVKTGLNSCEFTQHHHQNINVENLENISTDRNNILHNVTHEVVDITNQDKSSQKHAFNCGAKEPQKLRATLFRKQVATMAQMMHMNDNEIQQLADFMWHTVEVHKEHYRKNCNYQQIVILSRLFMALEAGDIERFKNKPLSEVEILLQNENLPWLEDELEIPNVMEDVELNKDVNGLIQEITENNINIPEERNKNILLSTSGTTPTKSLSSVAIQKIKGTPENFPKKKKNPFTPEELKVLEDHLGKFFARGKYPKQSQCFYEKLLQENKHIFHRKRTVQTLHSYVQNEIRKFK